MGGAFYIEESDGQKSIIDNSLRYQIINSTIQNASAEIGGAIYVANIQNLSISGCNLTNNTAY